MPHIHEKIDFVTDAYIVHKGRVLLVLHKKLKEWLPVGGHIELDEDPEEALFREVKEECGLDIELLAEKPKQISARRKLLYAPAYLDIHEVMPGHRHVGLTYFARAKTDRVRLAAEEHDDIRWFTPEELAHPEFHVATDIQFFAREALKRA
jgi:8-oxo-dGTP pyrophosphatase MutT (NUDIX family)